MSTRLGDWASNAKSGRPSSYEGITQQPGSFYNGNFSSSIWGNPVTPPFWRDTPPSSYGSCSSTQGHASEISSLARHKMDTSCKSRPSSEQVSNLTGCFSSEVHAMKQDLAGSPFTFGFPAPPLAPSFSYTCKEGMQRSPSFSQGNFTARNADVGRRRRITIGSSMRSDKRNTKCFVKERVSLLEELSKSWEATMQAHAGLLGSLDGPSTNLLAGDQALPSDGQQPLRNVHGSSVADPEMHKTSIHDKQSVHPSCAGPDHAPSETARSIFENNDGVGTFVFGSSTTLGMNINVGLPRQKCFSSFASRGRPRSSLACIKGRKPKNVANQRSTAAPMSRASQPGPYKLNMDSSCSSSSFLKFTMGVSDSSSSQCPEPQSKDRSNASRDCAPDSCRASSLFPGAASPSRQDRGSPATLNVMVNKNSVSQGTQAFNNQFSAWHPFPLREQNSSRDSYLTGATLKKGTLSLNALDRKPERRETSSKADFLEEHPKSCSETKSTTREPKLTEFDLNATGRLPAENLQERAAKGQKLREEIKQQKENQEPNFYFGNHKEFRPFVFGSSSSCNTKHRVSNSDGVMTKECSFRGTKDSKHLEHLVAKPGERMAGLRKSVDNLDDRKTVFEGSKNCSASDFSSRRFCKDEQVKGKGLCRSGDTANVFEESDCSVDKIREQLRDLARLDAEDYVRLSNETTNDTALEHGVRELCNQISKIGRFGDKRHEERSASEAHYRDSNDNKSILRAVEELTEQIAKLNNVVRDKNESEFSSSRLQQCDTLAQSLEDLRDRIKTLGKVGESGSDHFTELKVNGDNKVFTASCAIDQKDSGSSHVHCAKAFVNNNQSGRVHFNPFTNVSCTNIFSSNQAQSSSSCIMENTFRGQPSMANPFAAREPSMTNPSTSRQPPGANPFTSREPSVINPFAAREPSMANPFTSRQPPGANPFTSREPSVINPFAARDPSMANPFTSRQPPGPNPFTSREPFVTNPFAAREPSMGNPFTSRQPPGAKPFTSRQPPVTNPFAAGQPSTIPDVHSGTKVFSFGMPSVESSVNAGSSVAGFEFQGSNGPLKGVFLQEKGGRACPKSTTREKANLAKSRRSSLFTSMSHSQFSPMEFSPCPNKAASPSPMVLSCEAEQESVLMSSAPKLEEVASMNVEEITIGTSNLKVGIDRESCKGSQKDPGSSEHASREPNPFIFRQKKGIWKRASRKGTTVFVTTEDFSANLQSMNGQLAYEASCGIDRGTSSFCPLADSKGARSVWSPSSGYSFSEKLEKRNEKAATVKIGSPLQNDEMNKDQKASLITGESPASALATKIAAAEQLCEKWRLRGNQAYAKGDYGKAEDCYTRGVSSVSIWNSSERCIRASMLCYSNRAATRMAIGRMREALLDCEQSMILDSSFLRVRLRAASCHLALGESKAAAALFTECWRLAKERSSFDLRVLEDATNGARKSQNLINLLEKASKLLQKETSTDALVALQLLDEALTISPLSEATLDLKAQALFLLRRFEDVVQHCQKTMPSAEENHGTYHHQESVQKLSVFLNLWRWRMCGKALLQLGRLDESSSLLTKHEEVIRGLPSHETANTESMSTTLTLIGDLLRHKTAGNESFQAGRHAEALEHYTAALSCNSESRPYNAVCFCNRAAASQALGHIVDAISDCSRAIILDSSYAKAISRRATLHERIRDFGQACNDLRRLITLLERQEAISKSPRAASKSAQDLRQAQERLDKATKEMKKNCAVDHYLILGLDATCSTGDIKKAYHKAALKHHPDKAGQFLVRGEHGDHGSLLKEVGDEVCRDAGRLFKLIGESYAILSDPVKRAQYDLEHHLSRASNSTDPGYFGDTEERFSPSGKTSRRWHHQRRNA